MLFLDLSSDPLRATTVERSTDFSMSCHEWFMSFRNPAGHCLVPSSGGNFNLIWRSHSADGWDTRALSRPGPGTREREYVEAARRWVASDWRIITRHILPNIIQL